LSESQQEMTRAPLAPRCRRGREHELFRRFRRTRERAVRDALVERFLPLALDLARRYPTGSEREDVQQVACLALVKAIDRFDPEAGTAFSSFATPTILGEIKRYFRDLGWVVRVPRDLQDRSVRVARARATLEAKLGRAATAAELAEAVGASVEDVLEALTSASAHRPASLDPGPDQDAGGAVVQPSFVERGFEAAETGIELDSLLEWLPELERAVLNLRFREDMLQREIAALLGLSQMQVSRLLARAIGMLQSLADDQASREPAATSC
jgi:RNA polymerase sigma-B factor